MAIHGEEAPTAGRGDGEWCSTLAGAISVIDDLYRAVATSPALDLGTLAEPRPTGPVRRTEAPAEPAEPAPSPPRPERDTVVAAVDGALLAELRRWAGRLGCSLDDLLDEALRRHLEHLARVGGDGRPPAQPARPAQPPGRRPGPEG